MPETNVTHDDVSGGLTGDQTPIDSAGDASANTPTEHAAPTENAPDPGLTPDAATTVRDVTESIPDIIPENGDGEDTSAALDELVRQAEEKNKEGGSDDDPGVDGKEDDDKPTETEQTDPDGESDAGGEVDGDSKGEGGEGEDKGGDESKVTDEEAEELFKDVELPKHARETTSVAFKDVKKLAAERINAAKEEAAKVRAEIEQLREKLEGKEPEEVKKQVEELTEQVDELKKFKQAVDIEGDPKFKVYDNRVERNNSRIVETLTTVGATEEQLKAVKDIGVENVNWDPIFAKLTPSSKRLIEAALLDNVHARAEKKDALVEAKENADKFFKEREAAEQASQQELTTRQKKTVEDLDSQAEWLQEQTIPQDAKPEDRKLIKAQNAFVKDLRAKLKVMLDDSSPEMHATMAYGNAMGYIYEAKTRELEGQLKSAQEAQEKAEAELARIRKASKGRGTPQIDNPNKSRVRTSEDDISRVVKVPTEQALDNLLEEVTGERA